MPKKPDRPSRSIYGPPDYSILEAHFELRLGFPEIAAARLADIKKKRISTFRVSGPEWAFFPAGGFTMWARYEVLPAPRVRIHQCFFDDGGMDPEDYGWHLEGTLHYCVDPYAWSRIGFKNVCVERQKFHTPFEIIGSTPELIEEICGINLAENFKRAVE